MDWTDDIDTVKPGEIIAFDFEILTNNATLKAAAISKIKKEVAAHPILDYQSGKLTEGLYNTETGREVAILRVLAQVRKTEKATPPVEVQEANIGIVGASIIAAVTATITVVILHKASKYIGAIPDPLPNSIPDAIKKLGSWGWIAGAVAAYLLFFRK